jgi:predicted N-acetyltransferase YhbS
VAEIVPLRGYNPDEIHALLDDAFGTDRKSRTAYKLREGVDYVDHLSFGLRDDDVLIGSIQCWPMALNHASGTTDLFLVGPVAVSPLHQNMGFGHVLMRHMLASATERDPPMAMIGDPEYYGRFDFSADQTSGWELPGPWERRRLLLRNPNGLLLPAVGTLGPISKPPQ